MAVTLVLYDIKSEETREKVLSALRARYSVRIKLTDGAYAIHTPLRPVHIYDHIREYLRSEDRLYVIPITQPYIGYGPRESTQWLSDYLSA
jgi:hypothetical protein